MSSEYKIGIIDDTSWKVTKIMGKFKKPFTKKKERYSNYKLVAYEVKIRDKMEEMLDEIINEELDAILIDYKLSSMENVNYTGVEFAKNLEEVLHDFPIFILTSYEEDLFNNEVFNAYQIFDFERYANDKNEREEVHSKIIQQILKIKKERQQWEEEIKTLLPIAGSSEEVDSRLIELDSKIEKSINGKSALSPKIKEELKSDKLMLLIEEVEKILNEE